MAIRGGPRSPCKDGPCSALHPSAAPRCYWKPAPRPESGPDDLDWVLVHQANIRIVEQLQERTGIAPEKWIVNMMGIGNTCSASVLLALGDLLDRNVTAAGNNVLLAGFGAGLTWAAALFEWGESARPPEGLPLHHGDQKWQRPIQHLP